MKLASNKKLALSKIIDKVDAKVRTSLEDEHKALRTFNEIKKILETKLDNVKIFYCGSNARGTGIGKPDLDIFVRFNQENKMFEKLEKAAKGITKWQKNYASHPYLKGKFNNFDIEVVPCLKFNGKIKSAVDRTIVHQEFMLKHLNEKNKKDIRVLKQLLKTQEIYGAEPPAHGFSGYLLECMVYYLKGLEGIVEFDFKENTSIGISQKTFSESILTVIDPIDSERNVAAVVSKQAYAKFIKILKILREKPNEKIFYNSISKKRLVKGNWIQVTLEAKEPVKEIVLSSSLKIMNGIKNNLEKNDFQVLYNSIEDMNKQIILNFLIDRLKINYKKIIGPPVYNERALKSFLKAKRIAGPFIEDMNYAIIIKPVNDEPIKTIEKYLKTGVIKQEIIKVKKISMKNQNTILEE
ncbi:CCA-adding enzyme [uncultured archaeon]|nr:CCA-adding enzyme [uncultured archaeon]